MNIQSTEPTDPSGAALWLMLGEIRGDLKYLVEERRSAKTRMDEMEAAAAAKLDEHAARLTSLERFKLKIGMTTAALGVLVPTGVTVAARKLGLL